MKVIAYKKQHNLLYYFVGAVFVILNYFKHSILGYRSPRTFSVNEIDKAVTYDFRVVEGWLQHLKSYTQEEIEDKVILELGPGADFGVGIILLALGAKKYIAIDAHRLAPLAPKEIYKKIFDELKEKVISVRAEYLQEELEKCLLKRESRICYYVDKRFKISTIHEKADIVFSQAAFEHFENFGAVLRELESAVKPNTVLIAEIDLKTHTGWIRDRDPLNIYRFSDNFWNAFRFKGSPNRLRSIEYKSLLELYGWTDVQIIPLTALDDEYVAWVSPSLSKKFSQFNEKEMRLLSIMLMARKG